jgi:hypothetical protein
MGNKEFKIRVSEIYPNGHTYGVNGKTVSTEEYCRFRIKEIIAKNEGNVFVGPKDYRRCELYNKTEIKTEYWFDEYRASWKISVSYNIPLHQVERAEKLKHE